MRFLLAVVLLIAAIGLLDAAVVNGNIASHVRAKKSIHIATSQHKIIHQKAALDMNKDADTETEATVDNAVVGYAIVRSEEELEGEEDTLSDHLITVSGYSDATVTVVITLLATAKKQTMYTYSIYILVEGLTEAEADTLSAALDTDAEVEAILPFTARVTDSDVTPTDTVTTAEESFEVQVTFSNFGSEHLFLIPVVLFDAGCFPSDGYSADLEEGIQDIGDDDMGSMGTNMMSMSMMNADDDDILTKMGMGGGGGMSMGMSMDDPVIPTGESTLSLEFDTHTTDECDALFTGNAFSTAINSEASVNVGVTDIALSLAASTGETTPETTPDTSGGTPDTSGGASSGSSTVNDNDDEDIAGRAGTSAAIYIGVAASVATVSVAGIFFIKPRLFKRNGYGGQVALVDASIHSADNHVIELPDVENSENVVTNL